MALQISFDDAVKLLAMQVYGNTTTESKGMAEDAMELALQEIASTTHLVSQEGEDTLSLTGANTYNLSEVNNKILRVVKAWTSLGVLEVMRKAEFVARHPDFAVYNVGIPRIIVLWGNNNLYVWPDQASTTLNMLYYELMEQADSSDVLWALSTIGRKYAEVAVESRAINFSAAKDAIKRLNSGETRASDSPIRFLPERRVSTVNRFKRERR